LLNDKDQKYSILIVSCGPLAVLLAGAFPELCREAHAVIVEFIKKWGF